MISLEKFKKSLTIIKKYSEINYEIFNFIMKFNYDEFLPFAEYEDLTIELLSEIMNDFNEDDFSVISYWVYELEFGSKYDKDIDPPIETIEDLYNYLIKNME